MLKRSVVIVLAMLYLVTVSGFALNLHYCFNRLSSVKIDAPANACVKVLQPGKMKCCKDKHIEIKVKDTHQAGSPAYWGKFFPVMLHSFTLADFTFSFKNASIQQLSYRGPPPLPPGTPLFLKNCTFRI